MGRGEGSTRRGWLWAAGRTGGPGRGGGGPAGARSGGRAAGGRGAPCEGDRGGAARAGARRPGFAGGRGWGRGGERGAGTWRREGMGEPFGGACAPVPGRGSRRRGCVGAGQGAEPREPAGGAPVRPRGGSACSAPGGGWGGVGGGTPLRPGPSRCFKSRRSCLGLSPPGLTRCAAGCGEVAWNREHRPGPPPPRGRSRVSRGRGWAQACGGRRVWKLPGLSKCTV